MLQIGLRMPDGEVALNGSHNLGMWPRSQSFRRRPRKVAAIGLAGCCDPATVAPCPAECAGTTDTPRMVLVRFDDVIGQPANFSVEWAGTLDEAGIIGSLTTGGTYDAAGKVYYHAAVLNSSTALRTTAMGPLRPIAATGPAEAALCASTSRASPRSCCRRGRWTSGAPLAVRALFGACELRVLERPALRCTRVRA